MFANRHCKVRPFASFASFTSFTALPSLLALVAFSGCASAPSHAGERAGAEETSAESAQSASEALATSPPLAGDFNGDGLTDAIRWNDAAKNWLVSLSTGTDFVTETWNGDWGSDGPIHLGDLNGDGKTDVFMNRDGDHVWTVNISTGNGFTPAIWHGAWGSDGPINVGDLNGDGKTDVFMWRDADKVWTVNLSNGNDFVGQIWHGDWGSDGPIHVGDLNGDGKADVFMNRDGDHVWTVNISTGSGFAPAMWHGAWGSDGPINVGDLNGDHKTDVFMWRDADKVWTVNLSNGSDFVGQIWHGDWGSDGPIHVTDLNGDGKSDVIMWRGDTWTANVSTGSGWTPMMIPGLPGTDFVNVGDVNGDHRGDVFMFHPTTNAFGVNVGLSGAWRGETWPRPVAPPRLNEIAYKASHNSYWVKRSDVVEAAASGVQERIMDQLLFEGVRSLELDLHTDSTPHEFKIFHTNDQHNSQCNPLSECLRELALFQHALPQHDPVVIHLELKELTGTFWGAQQTPQDLDAILESYLGPYLFRPRDMMANCSGAADVRDCLRTRGWPTVDALRGKFIFTLIGNWTGGMDPCVNSTAVDNPRAWVLYANQPGGILARSAFLTESPGIVDKMKCEGMSDAQIGQAFAATAFLQMDSNASALNNPDVRRAVADNRIVRADFGGDNKPTMLDQQLGVAAGMGEIQNDYPWYAYNDLAPRRPGIPLHPEQFGGPISANEPGYRILFHEKVGGASSSLAIPLSGVPTTRWEAFVANTRHTTSDDRPNFRAGHGVGCIYARTPDQRQGMRVCRGTTEGHWGLGGPVGEDAIITVDVSRDGSTQTSTFYSSDSDTGGKGELLRLDVSQSGSVACVSAYSTERVVNDAPQWQSLQSVCFNGTFSDQGLAAHDGDVLFVGAKMSQGNSAAIPASATTYLTPAWSDDAGYAVQNLSW